MPIFEKRPVDVVKVRGFCLDDMNYSPNWRQLQAQKLLDALHLANNNTGRYFLYPKWLKDDYVKNLFLYLREDTSMPDYELYRIIHETKDYNSNFGWASRLKAFLCSGMSIPQIAREIGCTERSVNLYSKLFFDIEPIRHYGYRLSSVVFPIGKTMDNTMLWEKQEFLWMAVGYCLGNGYLMDALTRKCTLSEKDTQRAYATMRSIVQSCAVEYAAFNRALGNPRAGDLIRGMEWKEIDSHQKGDDADVALREQKEWHSMVIRAIHGDVLKRDSDIGFMKDEVRQAIATPFNQEVIDIRSEKIVEKPRRTERRYMDPDELLKVSSQYKKAGNLDQLRIAY
jgi:hypothetical protein